MLLYAAAGNGARFMGLVHHTDADREWAYDHASHIGMLDKALDEATAKGWAVVYGPYLGSKPERQLLPRNRSPIFAPQPYRTLVLLRQCEARCDPGVTAEKRPE